MLRRLMEILFIVIVLAIGAAMGAARLWPKPGEGFWWRAAELARMPKDIGAVDLTTLQRRVTHNDALICPESKCTKAKADVVAPIFPVPVAELRRKLDIVVHSEPRSAELTCGANCDRIGRYVEYSALFQFPDIIDVEVVEAGANASTLAIYSRSVFGYWDFDVNRERAARWVAALQRIIPKS